MKPQYAVISLGLNNSYGYPHKQAMAVLEGSGAQIYRTDLQGDITVKTDGRNIEITPAKR